MKILVVSMKYDYGEKARGLSGSEEYFEKPLSRQGHELISFDFMERFHQAGREAMNAELLGLVRNERPKVVIIIPASNEFLPKTIEELKQYATIVGYFYDDPWRVHYCKFWAQHYTFVTTSDVNGVGLWRDRGVQNVVYSPFACSHDIFQKKNLGKKWDVSFVGQYHPYRAWLIKRLRASGCQVAVWGWGWKGGRVDFEQMANIFNQSRINLNLSNNESWDLRYILSPFRPLTDSLRAWKATARAMLRKDQKVTEMVKARHFEINACGGFQLSFAVEGLESHFEIRREIAIYESVERLADKIRYYLKHADERESIAERGYERSRKDHTLERRFARLLTDIGLGSAPESRG